MHHPMLTIAIEAAREASKMILRFMDQLETIDISKKGHHDIVTQVDRLAEETIINIIQQSYPDHAILAEESGEQSGHEYCWIIDPLDGTTNYMHGLPHFAISIAVKKNDQLEIGLVYDPIRQELFTAARGQGAQLNNRRLRVSQIKKLDQALVGTGFPFKETHHLKPYLRTFEQLFPLTAGIRRAGSAALDLAYVAAGRLDGFWEASLKEWDMAAGILLITEAGGFVSDFQGEKHYIEHGNLIAGNPKIFKSILEVVQGSLKKYLQ